jgi:hypothetical protein
MCDSYLSDGVLLVHVLYYLHLHCDVYIMYVQLYVCGQAKSHCVQYTVRDIIKYWDIEKRRNPDKVNLKLIYLIEDGKLSSILLNTSLVRKER